MAKHTKEPWDARRVRACVNAGLEPTAIRDVVEALEAITENVKLLRMSHYGLGPLIDNARIALAKARGG